MKKKWKVKWSQEMVREKKLDGCHELGKGTSMEKYNLVCGGQVWDQRG